MELIATRRQKLSAGTKRAQGFLQIFTTRRGNKVEMRILLSESSARDEDTDVLPRPINAPRFPIRTNDTHYDYTSRACVCLLRCR